MTSPRPAYYLSVDLEGVLGVTSPHQCFPGADRSGYQQAVAQLALEVTTVVEALGEGVDILINDSHSYMVNLAPSALPPTVRLLSGKPKACAMSAGLTSAFQGAFYIGYHAMAGCERGVLCHTFHDRLYEVSVNGLVVGESGFNALYASLVHQVPVCLISGDDTVCAEFQRLVPGVETVMTKTGLGFSSALSRPWRDVATDYRQVVQRILQNPNPAGRQRPQLNAPYTLQVRFLTTADTDTVAMMPWVQRLDGRTVSVTTDEFSDCYRALQSLYAIIAYKATP